MNPVSLVDSSSKQTHSQATFTVRVPFATIAFGMGCETGCSLWVCSQPWSLCTINWSCWLRRPASWVGISISKHSQNLSKVQTAKSMKTFLSFLNEHSCRKQHLLRYFTLDGKGLVHCEQSPKCTCCAVCRETCDCGACTPLPYHQGVSDEEMQGAGNISQLIGTSG